MRRSLNVSLSEICIGGDDETFAEVWRFEEVFTDNILALDPVYFGLLAQLIARRGWLVTKSGTGCVESGKIG